MRVFLVDVTLHRTLVRYKQTDPSHHLRRAIVALVGPCAEQRWRAPLSAEDREHLIRTAWVTDLADATKHAELASVELDPVKQSARVIVSLVWPAVESVAHALLLTGCLYE